MNRKLATVLLAAGVVTGFGSGILSLGCSGHRHHDKGRYAADCERHRGQGDKPGPAQQAPAAPAPDSPSPDAPAPDVDGSGSL